MSIPSVTVGGVFERDRRNARTKLVFPAPPRPTSISFVRLQAADPLVNRCKKAMVCVWPRRMISIGGVFSERHPVKFSSFKGKNPTSALMVSNSMQ